MPGKREIKEVHTTAILGTVHITAQGSDAKLQNIFHGRNNITCSTDCNYRTAATLCTLETWFVFGV